LVDLNATLIAQIINFLILVGILTKFAYKPLTKALAERQAKIENSIAEAEQQKAAAAALHQEYQEQLASARTQAQAIVDKAIKVAEESKEEIIAAARAEHARLLKVAQEEIDRERERALAEMRSEVVSLSLAAAGKIIGQNLDEQGNAQLVEQFIAQLDEKKIGGLPC